MVPLGLMNPELIRKKEFERRKKLRLLQVRQQSKEFADKLRERIKGEVTKQKEKYLEAEEKLKQEKHLKELCQLKELYDKCVNSIGEGHREAAKQPDLNTEKQAEFAVITEKAIGRAATALKKHHEEKSIQKKKTEAPVKRKKATRNKENLRAFYISSLPKLVEHSSAPLLVPPSKSHQHTEPLETRKVLEEIPSNLTGPNIKEKDVQRCKSPEKLNDPRKETNEEKEHMRKAQETFRTLKQKEDSLYCVPSPKDCSCDYIVCPCHKSSEQLRRCSSESRISSEHVFDFEEPRKEKVRSRSCSPRSVRTLNYFESGNVYESNQQSCVKVTHHCRSPKTTSKEPVSNTEGDLGSKLASVEELKRRRDERGAKALRKEQLKRDFHQLIENLKRINKEKSVISSKSKGKPKVYFSERDILERNKNKQNKLNDAFEKLPHCLKSIKTHNTGIQKSNQIPTDDSSPPTLNLALCQTNMYNPIVRRVVSEEISVSSCPSSSQVMVKESRRGKSAKSTRSASPQNTRQRDRVNKGKPDVLVDKDPSGDVHITVKVSEILGGGSKSKSAKSKESPISDSSYMSPPANLTPSQQELLNSLLCQVNKKGIGREMKKYIRELLSMSRESIDDLRGPGSTQNRKAKRAKPSPSSKLDEDLEKEFAKLSQLAEVYAEKVNTLVDMYEEMTPSEPGTPTYVDPVRAPPRDYSNGSRGPTPRSTRSANPSTPRGPIYPSPVPGSATPSSGYGRTSQPRYTPCPCPSGPTPEQIQESLDRTYHPERPQTPTPSYIPSFPVPSSPWGSPHIPPVAPPGSAGSRIPIAEGREPRATRSPPPPPPQPYNRPPTPLKRPPQPMVNYPLPTRAPRREPPQPTRPHPFDQPPWKGFRPQTQEEEDAIHSVHLHEKHARPDLGFSRIPPLPVPCPPSPGPTRGPVTPPPGFDQTKLPISFRYHEQNAMHEGRLDEKHARPDLGSSRIPPRPIPHHMSPGTTRSPATLPPGFDHSKLPISTQHHFDRDPVASSTPKTPCPCPSDTSVGLETSSSIGDDTLELAFGGIQGAPMPTKAEIKAASKRVAQMPSTVSPPPPNWDMEGWFNEKRDKILRRVEESSTRLKATCGAVNEVEENEGPEYYDDMDGDVDEDIAQNWQSEMALPASPGSSQGSLSLSDSSSIKLDSSFDTSALKGPVDKGKLEAVRSKLSVVCNKQYREILEMLQGDTTEYKLDYGKLLDRPTPDPFLDEIDKMIPSQFVKPSRTKKVDFGLDQSINSDRSLDRSGFEYFRKMPLMAQRDSKDFSEPKPASRSPRLSPKSRGGAHSRSAKASPEFDLSLQFSNFPDEYNHLDPLDLLVKAQEERKV